MRWNRGFHIFWSQNPFLLLRVTKDLKELLFIQVISIDIYCIKTSWEKKIYLKNSKNKNHHRFTYIEFLKKNSTFQNKNVNKKSDIV